MIVVMTTPIAAPLTARPTFASLVFGTWPARIYLGVVALLTLPLIWVHITGDDTMAAIPAFFATAPASYLAVIVADSISHDVPQWAGYVVFEIGIVFGAIVNAILISLATRLVTRMFSRSR